MVQIGSGSELSVVGSRDMKAKMETWMTMGSSVVGSVWNESLESSWRMTKERDRSAKLKSKKTVLKNRSIDRSPLSFFPLCCVEVRSFVVDSQRCSGSLHVPWSRYHTVSLKRTAFFRRATITLSGLRTCSEPHSVGISFQPSLTRPPAGLMGLDFSVHNSPVRSKFGRNYVDWNCE